MNRGRRKLLSGWSLETKCLVALGLALAISFVFAMFLMQWIASRLVLETTRLEARDFAISSLLSQHINAFALQPPRFDDQQTEEAKTAEPVISIDNNALMEIMRREMTQSSNSYELLRLDDHLEWKNLQGKFSESDIDLAKLYALEAKLANDGSLTPLSPNQENSPENEPAAATNSVTDLADQLSIQLSGPTLSNATFEEFGPVDGFYYYYHPIRFRSECMTCHQSANEAAVDALPFRVVRVQRPYEDTRVWTIWTYSLMISVAVATLSIALFLEHRILKRLVIRPVKYLRDIADRVAGGELAVRSEIDTGDELQSLSNSFNDMLRHLIHTQLDLQNVNKQLDDKVDDLARMNLELFEANRMKNEFLANMSHELRTPLNSILGFSDVLQNLDVLNDKQKRYASNIQRSGRILLDMINDILDLAKIEAGKMQVRPTPFDLHNTVVGQCELLRPMSDEKNIDLQVQLNIPANEGLDVFQDLGKLQQILNNLLSNAIKFTPEGGFIQVTIEKVDDEFFTIAVSDSGVGIAESDLDVIFEKFRQVRLKESADSLTREVSGTGLGLSITRELCTLLGGRIEVESTVGKGSVFTITLPQNFEQMKPEAPDINEITAE